MTRGELTVKSKGSRERQAALPLRWTSSFRLPSIALSSCTRVALDAQLALTTLVRIATWPHHIMVAGGHRSAGRDHPAFSSKPR